MPEQKPDLAMTTTTDCSSTTTLSRTYASRLTMKVVHSKKRPRMTLPIRFSHRSVKVSHKAEPVEIAEWEWTLVKWCRGVKLDDPLVWEVQSTVGIYAKSRDYHGWDGARNRWFERVKSCLKRWLWKDNLRAKIWTGQHSLWKGSTQECSRQCQEESARQGTSHISCWGKAHAARANQQE